MDTQDARARGVGLSSLDQGLARTPSCRMQQGFGRRVWRLTGSASEDALCLLFLWILVPALLPMCIPPSSQTSSVVGSEVLTREVLVLRVDAKGPI